MSMLKHIPRGVGLNRWGVIACTFSVSLLLATGVALAQGGGKGPGGNPGGGPGGTPGGGPGGGGAGGGDEEGAGNNLSFPVIWSDGIDLPLRGTPGVELMGGEFTTIGGMNYYHQQDELNEWQASSFNAVSNGVGPVDVTEVDWGDNLEARPWTENSQVRVETVLYQNLDPTLGFPNPTDMTGYNMAHIAGQGTDEMWGTDFTTYEPGQATVYSDFARLTIQRIGGEQGDQSLEWDPVAKQWTGDNAEQVWVSKAVYDGGDGPGFYSSETNIQGKVIYGYNWNVRKEGNGPGVYRLTFSLDQVDELGNPLPVNTLFDSTFVTPFSEEETDEVIIAAEPIGGLTAMDWDNDLTYIDVLITPRLKGGKQPSLGVGVVPEPSPFALAGIVLLGGAVAVYRRRK